MIDTDVQKGAVVRDEQEAALGFQVIRNQRAGFRVQMVGRLVNQQEAVFPREQQREQQLNLFPAGKRAERTVQDIVRQVQPVHLARKLPVFVVRLYIFDHADRVLGRVGDGKGEVVERHSRTDRALVLVFVLQQLEQRGLAAAVAADQSKPPVRVQPERDIFEDVVIAAVIGKGQV